MASATAPLPPALPLSRRPRPPHSSLISPNTDKTATPPPSATTQSKIALGVPAKYLVSAPAPPTQTTPAPRDIPSSDTVAAYPAPSAATGRAPPQRAHRKSTPQK